MVAKAKEMESEAGLYGIKPQLLIPGAKAAAAVKFYEDAFGAEELQRVWHSKLKNNQNVAGMISSKLKIGSSVLLVSDRFDEGGEGGSAASFSGIVIWMETEDVDKAVKRALAAGAELVSEVAVHENGVFGKVKDPYDVVWVIESAPKNFKPQN